MSNKLPNIPLLAPRDLAFICDLLIMQYQETDKKNFMDKLYISNLLKILNEEALSLTTIE